MQGWFRQGKTTCPLTGIQLTSIQLTTNYALKNAIQSFKQKKAAAKASGMETAGLQYPVIQVKAGQLMACARLIHLKALLLLLLCHLVQKHYVVQRDESIFYFTVGQALNPSCMASSTSQCVLSSRNIKA